MIWYRVWFHPKVLVSRIKKFIKEFKILFSFSKWNIDRVLPLIGFSLVFFPFIINCSVLDTVSFDIPHLYTLSVHYNCSLMFWPLVYFYLTCRYIKIKIKEQNYSIAKVIDERKVIKSQKILRSIRILDAIYSELNQCSNKFWSLYLLSIWLIFSVLIIFVLFLFLR